MVRYPWPASALTPDEMALLYHARERSPSRVPITQLIAEAVRVAYGHLANQSVISTKPTQKGSQYARTRIPEHDLEENPTARPAA